MDTYHRLVSQFGAEFEFSSAMWKFGILHDPELNQMAARDAVDARVVIIAIHHSSDLPDVAKEWLEVWSAQKKGQTSALVALLKWSAAGEAPAGRTETFLKDLAGRVGMDFLLQKVSIPEISHTSTGTGTPGSRPTPPERALTPPPYESWGIND